jgi:hypothetical protein
MDLRREVIRLAYSSPELRPYLLPILKTSVMKRPLTREQVEALGAAAINRALDSLDKEQSLLLDQLIEAGFGRTRLQEILKMDHPVAQQYAKVTGQINLLRGEVERRYGPGAPSRLPRGFGPIKKSSEGDPHPTLGVRSLTGSTVRVSINVPETEKARQYYPDHHPLVGVFEDSVPLYRIVDERELQRVLGGSPVKGGPSFSMALERKYGAQWASSLGNVLQFGREHQDRLEPPLFVFQIDGKGHTFYHMDVPGVDLSQGGVPVLVSSSFCTNQWGCSVLVAPEDIEKFYRVTDDWRAIPVSEGDLRDEQKTRERLLDDPEPNLMQWHSGDTFEVVWGSPELGLKSKAKGVVKHIRPRPGGARFYLRIEPRFLLKKSPLSRSPVLDQNLQNEVDWWASTPALIFSRDIHLRATIGGQNVTLNVRRT